MEVSRARKLGRSHELRLGAWDLGPAPERRRSDAGGWELGTARSLNNFTKREPCMRHEKETGQSAAGSAARGGPTKGNCATRLVPNIGDSPGAANRSFQSELSDGCLADGKTC
jgi:hypothetical protein